MTPPKPRQKPRAYQRHGLTALHNALRTAPGTPHAGHRLPRSRSNTPRPIWVERIALDARTAKQGTFWTDFWEHVTMTEEEVAHEQFRRAVTRR